MTDILKKIAAICDINSGAITQEGDTMQSVQKRMDNAAAVAAWANGLRLPGESLEQAGRRLPVINEAFGKLAAMEREQIAKATARVHADIGSKAMPKVSYSGGDTDKAIGVKRGKTTGFEKTAALIGSSAWQTMRKAELAAQGRA